MALRLTPPLTTISPTLHIISWHSKLDNLRFCAPLNVAIQKLNRSIKGAGPEALPPNVFSLAPAGLTSETSHLGTSPAHRSANTCLNALAQPSLLSLTIIVVSLSNMVGTSGNLDMYCRSTLNPTPVPHSSINIASSKLLGSSTGR